MPEGWSLELLKLVLRILIQTCYLCTSYILVRVSIYRKNGGLDYNAPLLQRGFSHLCLDSAELSETHKSHT